MTDPLSPPPLPTRDAIYAMPPFSGLDREDIHLVATPENVAAALEVIMNTPVVGFDTESRPTFRKGQKSEGPHVLQFATEQGAYIFQTLHKHCKPAVVEILRAKQVAKIGFGLNDDIARISEKFHIRPKSIIDLDFTFKRSFGYKNSIGVKSAVALLFSQRFTKSHKATTSNWANTALTEKQLRYAANDAYAAIIVYRELEKRGVEVAVHPQIAPARRERP